VIKALSRVAIRYGLIPMVHWIVRLYLRSVRIRWVNEKEIRDHLRKGGRVIAAIWHQRILIVLGYAKRFSEFSPSVMISRSRDGEIIADVYRRLNFRPVRGSSSRGGREALSAMIADLAEHPFAVHVVDGPQGPRGVIKAGLISMAKLSAAPIYPVYISVDRAWVLKSWDRFLIPKPFSRVVIRWDGPIPIPPELDVDAFETLRLEIEKRMRENQEEEDRKSGWTESLF
jgi:lysophospholipid acyltransferase (LPLAT)-like uncharacterized protein